MKSRISPTWGRTARNLGARSGPSRITPSPGRGEVPSGPEIRDPVVTGPSTSPFCSAAGSRGRRPGRIPVGEGHLRAKRLMSMAPGAAELNSSVRGFVRQGLCRDQCIVSCREGATRGNGPRHTQAIQRPLDRGGEPDEQDRKATLRGVHQDVLDR